MRSPFPGMDPYLEHPARWRGVHAHIISTLGEMLNERLPKSYWADIEERVYVEREDAPPRAIYPDVAVATSRGLPPPSSGAPATDAGCVVVEEVIEVSVHEAYLVIREMPSHEIVTVLEVLSPTNKLTGAGRSEYLRKRGEVLASRASLVEIDLLRDGARPAWTQRLAPMHYLVAVHRVWERPRLRVWPWTLRGPIPMVPVPLLSGAEPILIDLRAALDQVYEKGAYGRVIDYTQPADPPLLDEDAAWVRALLGR